MTIQHAYQEFQRQLQQVYDTREADNITSWAIEHITGLRKIDVVIQKTKALDHEQEEQLRKCLGELLLQKPIQYVLNEAWFAGMKFYVNEHVFIPRPETEELVEWISEQVRSTKYEVQKSRSAIGILDVGTGSGCIAIVLKKKLPELRITAIDISNEALEVVKKNAAALETDIDFLQLDFLKLAQRDKLPKFDLIVSNPPYIPRKDQLTMSPTVVDYEPHVALFVEDDDPLLFYRLIADFAKDHLNPSGKIFLEIHEDLGEKVSKLFKERDFASVELRKDMQGKDRMMKIVNRES